MALDIENVFDTSLESQQMAKDIENVFGTSLESHKMDKCLVFFIIVQCSYLS